MSLLIECVGRCPSCQSVWAAVTPDRTYEPLSQDPFLVFPDTLSFSNTMSREQARPGAVRPEARTPAAGALFLWTPRLLAALSLWPHRPLARRAFVHPRSCHSRLLLPLPASVQKWIPSTPWCTRSKGRESLGVSPSGPNPRPAKEHCPTSEGLAARSGQPRANHTAAAGKETHVAIAVVPSGGHRATGWP